jgi:3-oxoacyl-(acyl-carrier-protein) synthase
MDYLLKSSLLVSLKALQEANISTPDAIITATTYGCWENTELLLNSITDEGESMQKPTYFMQSTHNTISGNIAVFTNCHGYNTTYSHGAKSLESALLDAQLLLQSGKCKNVLVGLHDKPTAHLQKIMTDAGANNIPEQISMAMVLTTK